MDGRAVGGGRKDASGREELVEIVANAMKQGIMGRREGGKEPRKRIAHGLASALTSRFVR
jgi:hypothetical protein